MLLPKPARPQTTPKHAVPTGIQSEHGQLKETDLRTLAQLLGSYIHQDWADEFESINRAVQAIMASEPPEMVAAGSREICELLAMETSEVRLAKIVTDELGCYYDPASAGETYREWLGDVLKQWEAKR
jgi:hypothetical protein